MDYTQMPNGQMPEAVVPPQAQSMDQMTDKRPRLFSFKGRLGRLRYFLVGLIASVIGWVVYLLLLFGTVVAIAFSAKNHSAAPMIVLVLISSVISILFIIVLLANVIKRFQDLNKSGWWVLAGLIPFYNIYLSLTLLFQAGTEGPNNYGQDPAPNTHHDFWNSIGSSVLAKLIFAILIFGLSVFVAYQSAQYSVQHPPLPQPQYQSSYGSNPFASSQSQGRDVKRLSDMRMMQSSLELYHTDYVGYPDAAGGFPQNMTPSYIKILPTAPTPADGSCTTNQNRYMYSGSGAPFSNNGATVYPSYTYTFCLGSSVGGLSAGPHTMTPQGIQ